MKNAGLQWTLVKNNWSVVNPKCHIYWPLPYSLLIVGMRFGSHIFPVVSFGLKGTQWFLILAFLLQKDTLEHFKCGADFLPSPLASKPRYALKAKEVLTKSGLLTAVAVAVENDHTIAFLGNNQGEVFKVELSFCLLNLFLFLFSFEFLPVGRRTKKLQWRPHVWATFFLFSVQVHLADETYVYSKTPGVTMGEKVNKNLFFDLSHSHLYITTEKKVCISGNPFVTHHL